MPQGENFWNPYHWVVVSEQPIVHAEPNYHHCLSYLSGRLCCELKALTPLLIGDGTGRFVRHRRLPQLPYIPATSLKGAIRSLAEVVGNATVPFPRSNVNAGHALKEAGTDTGQLDIVTRTYGYLQEPNVFAGLIRFSNAEITERPQDAWPRHQIDVGQPELDHGAFYRNDRKQRKFYHHQWGIKTLTKPRSGTTLRWTLRIYGNPNWLCCSIV